MDKVRKLPKPSGIKASHAILDEHFWSNQVPHRASDVTGRLVDQISAIAVLIPQGKGDQSVLTSDCIIQSSVYKQQFQLGRAF